jgi:elongation factor P
MGIAMGIAAEPARLLERSEGRPRAVGARAPTRDRIGLQRALRCLPREDQLVAISTNQFKNGNHIEVEGTVFKILEFQHVKPGKGGAFVRTKLRRASDGAVIDRTFRAGEKFRPVRTEARKMQFLYADGSDAHFMDSESFEQLAVPESRVKDALRWIVPSDEVDVLFIDEQPSDVQLPSAVELEVAQTAPGLRGDSVSSGGTKPATLQTGAEIQVPLFIEPGERVRVDTRSGEYVARA